MAARLQSASSALSTLRLLVGRDLKVKYAGSILGYVWSVLDPLLLALVYWFVFTKIFQRRHIEGSDPYILFLLLGLLPWFWANGVIGDSTRSLTAEALLVRSTNLTRQIWVVRTVASKFAEFLLSLPVLVLFILIYRHEVSASRYVFAVPLGLILQFLLLTGIGLILAPVTVLFRDVERLVRVAMRILFYLSPVLYGIKDVPESVRPLAALNPLAGILDLYRASFYPSQFAGWGAVGISAAWAVGMFLIGWAVFAKLENPVLKEI
ncbi:MAG: type transport system permease protein [Frankiaceae bacterium]|nr:type transport system permease protein [Frankiaceae bacterium]